MEAGLTPEEQQTYDEWFQRRRALLEAQQWTEALRDVPRLTDLQPAGPCALPCTALAGHGGFGHVSGHDPRWVGAEGRSQRRRRLHDPRAGHRPRVPNR